MNSFLNSSSEAHPTLLSLTSCSLQKRQTSKRETPARRSPPTPNLNYTGQITNLEELAGQGSWSNKSSDQGLKDTIDDVIESDFTTGITVEASKMAPQEHLPVLSWQSAPLPEIVRLNEEMDRSSSPTEARNGKEFDRLISLLGLSPQHRWSAQSEALDPITVDHILEKNDPLESRCRGVTDTIHRARRSILGTHAFLNESKQKVDTTIAKVQSYVCAPSGWFLHLCEIETVVFIVPTFPADDSCSEVQITAMKKLQLQFTIDTEHVPARLVVKEIELIPEITADSSKLVVFDHEKQEKRKSVDSKEVHSPCRFDKTKICSGSYVFNNNNNILDSVERNKAQLPPCSDVRNFCQNSSGGVCEVFYDEGRYSFDQRSPSEMCETCSDNTCSKYSFDQRSSSEICETYCHQSCVNGENSLDHSISSTFLITHCDKSDVKGENLSASSINTVPKVGSHQITSAMKTLTISPQNHICVHNETKSRVPVLTDRSREIHRFCPVNQHNVQDNGRCSVQDKSKRKMNSSLTKSHFNNDLNLKQIIVGVSSEAFVVEFSDIRVCIKGYYLTSITHKLLPFTAFVFQDLETNKTSLLYGSYIRKMLTHDKNLRWKFSATVNLQSI